MKCFLALVLVWTRWNGSFGSPLTTEAFKALKNLKDFPTPNDISKDKTTQGKIIIFRKPFDRDPMINVSPTYFTTIRSGHAMTAEDTRIAFETNIVPALSSSTNPNDIHPVFEPNVPETATENFGEIPDKGSSTTPRPDATPTLIEDDRPKPEEAETHKPKEDETLKTKEDETLKTMEEDRPTLKTMEEDRPTPKEAETLKPKEDEKLNPHEAERLKLQADERLESKEDEIVKPKEDEKKLKPKEDEKLNPHQAERPKLQADERLESKEDEIVKTKENERLIPKEDETLQPKEDETLKPKEDETLKKKEDEKKLKPKQDEKLKPKEDERPTKPKEEQIFPTPQVSALTQLNVTKGRSANETTTAKEVRDYTDFEEILSRAVENTSAPQDPDVWLGHKDAILESAGNQSDSDEIFSASLNRIIHDVGQSPFLLTLLLGTLLALFIMGFACGVLMKTWCCRRKSKPLEKVDREPKLDTNLYTKMTNPARTSDQNGWQFHPGSHLQDPRNDSNGSKLNIYHIQDTNPRTPRVLGSMSQSDMNLAKIQPTLRPHRPKYTWSTTMPHTKAPILPLDDNGYSLPHTISRKDILPRRNSQNTARTCRSMSAVESMQLSLLEGEGSYLDENDVPQDFPPPPPSIADNDNDDNEHSRRCVMGMTSFAGNGKPRNQSTIDMSTYDWDNVVLEELELQVITGPGFAEKIQRIIAVDPAE
eukprot:maker-scaffold29_size597861-snap-gene-4.36 protein:Tk04656 transcript:maker-scaffold29_size597861-snap-gene-4.36-mRNA-1 annotation:"neurofilament protein"